VFYIRLVDRIGVRELNQHTSRYLLRVKAGETIEVTDRGQPIARLVPVRPPAGLLERLVAVGEVQPPTSDLDLLDTMAALPPLPPDGVDVAAELSEARQDERW
jgi:prevent-host-death family protein